MDTALGYQPAQGLEGALLREQLRTQWALPPAKCPGTRILPYTITFLTGELDTSVIRIKRHSKNNRHYAYLRNLYRDLLLSGGYTREDAGELCLVQDASDPDWWWAIGGATRAEAFVLAYEKEPSNPQLQLLIRQGGYDATFLSASTPMWAVRFLVKQLNAKNGVGATSDVALLPPFPT